MRTDEEAWLREQLQLDAPPPMAPLDGREVLRRGRTRRRRQRIATTTPLAGAAALLLGTSLWAAELLPGAVQGALPAVPGNSAACPELAAGSGPSADGGAGTVVTSDVAHLAVMDWRATDGTQVWVIRTPVGCLVPGEQDGGDETAGGVGLSVLTQAPEGPLVLHGSRDPGEDVRRWGASLLQVPGQDVVVATVPAAAERVALSGGEPVEQFMPILDEQDEVVAKVARLSYTGDNDPAALLWQVGDAWSLSWTSADVVAGPLPEEWGSEPAPSPSVDLPTWSAWPQLARTEDDGRWWAWMGGSDVLGPVDAPEGPWAMHLTDDELGDTFIGWVPEGTEQLVIDGERWDLLAMEQTIGVTLERLTPFARNVYQPAQRVVAVGQDGEQSPIQLIEAPSTN